MFRSNQRSSPLFLAAWKGQREIVEFLAFKGADIHRIDDDGWSLMFTAAFHGQVAVIEALAALDCSIEAPTSSPTPLLTAIRGNHVEAVQLLLELNANTANAEAETYHDEILQMLDDQAKKSVAIRNVFGKFSFFISVPRRKRKGCELETRRCFEYATSSVSG